MMNVLYKQAAEVAKTAAKSITDMPDNAEDSESPKEEEAASEGESESEESKKRKAALEKLEKAGEDSVLGQASLLFFFWDICKTISRLLFCEA